MILCVFYNGFHLGYDLRQENLFLSKLLENVGSVVYNNLEDSDKPVLFEITGVLSTMGEKLPFNQVMLCNVFFFLY